MDSSYYYFSKNGNNSKRSGKQKRLDPPCIPNCRSKNGNPDYIVIYEPQGVYDSPDIPKLQVQGTSTPYNFSRIEEEAKYFNNLTNSNNGRVVYEEIEEEISIMEEYVLTDPCPVCFRYDCPRLTQESNNFQYPDENINMSYCINYPQPQRNSSKIENIYSDKNLFASSSITGSSKASCFEYSSEELYVVEESGVCPVECRGIRHDKSSQNPEISNKKEGAVDGFEMTLEAEKPYLDKARSTKKSGITFDNDAMVTQVYGGDSLTRTSGSEHSKNTGSTGCVNCPGLCDTGMLHYGHQTASNSRDGVSSMNKAKMYDNNEYEDALLKDEQFESVQSSRSLGSPRGKVTFSGSSNGSNRSSPFVVSNDPHELFDSSNSANNTLGMQSAQGTNEIYDQIDPIEENEKNDANLANRRNQSNNANKLNLSNDKNEANMANNGDESNKEHESNLSNIKNEVIGVNKGNEANKENQLNFLNEENTTNESSAADNELNIVQGEEGPKRIKCYRGRIARMCIKYLVNGVSTAQYYVYTYFLKYLLFI